MRSSLAVLFVIFVMSLIALDKPATPARAAVGVANPFFNESNLPFHAPPFDKIKNEDFQPAIEAGMREQLKEIEPIANNSEQPTFDNTIVALEKTGEFHGTYHVLGGLVSPIDGIGPEQLHIAELVKRIDDDTVQEIILATNPSMEGDATALYLRQQLLPFGVHVTRLARGLPVIAADDGASGVVAG